MEGRVPLETEAVNTKQDFPTDYMDFNQQTEILGLFLQQYLGGLVILQ